MAEEMMSHGWGLTPYEQFMMNEKTSRHPSKTAVAGLVLGTVGAALGVGAWIFAHLLERKGERHPRPRNGVAQRQQPAVGHLDFALGQRARRARRTGHDYLADYHGHHQRTAVLLADGAASGGAFLRPECAEPAFCTSRDGQPLRERAEGANLLGSPAVWLPRMWRIVRPRQGGTSCPAFLI